jgi:Helicase
MPKKATKQLSLQRDLARACDPVLFARDLLDVDPVQAELLSSSSRRILVNCCRQWGKSSTTALLAVHACLYEAPARVVLVSPSMQQSTELFKKCMGYLEKLSGVPQAKQSSLTRLELQNQSRIISLPGSERTVRGYSATLVVIDECARCSDELIAAVRPMLAASESGRLVCLSTPAGRRGFFYEQWTNGENWHRIQVRASECPRISPAFLEEEKKALGPFVYESEYCAIFHDSDASLFSSELIAAALVSDFEAFIADDV